MRNRTKFLTWTSIVGFPFAVFLSGCGAATADGADDSSNQQPEKEVAIDLTKGLGEMKFPAIEGTHIEGAPYLKEPVLIMGETVPLKTEKHGLAAPALWDWNGDGKRDLLVGEFETNSGESFPMHEDGSTVRVYLNVGTDEKPQFTDDFQWAMDTEGTIMEVEQWCCIGFTPYFYDLNNDGYQDIITGQYHPGHVTWFRGSEEGFLPGLKLEQEGDPTSAWNPAFAPDETRDEIESFDYWVYSSASMGDFDGDGDYDLITGGSSLRISENVGSKTEPKFARRQLLLDVNGNPLIVRHRTDEEIEMLKNAGITMMSGDSKTSPYVVDWDRDGVLDLLVTGSYTHPGDFAVAFFKGVQTEDGPRFHPAVDLLKTADGSKALPGSGPRLFVDDWNKDGTPDLIIGASVATVNGGEFSNELSWEWESVNEVEAAGKDPGRYPPQEKPTRESWGAMFPDGYPGGDEAFEASLQMNIDYWEQNVGSLYKENKEHWLTMRHQGRIYVMFGSEKPTTASFVPSEQAPSSTEPSTDETSSTQSSPVNMDMYIPRQLNQGENAEISLNINIQDGWYIYAPTGKNAEQGMKETIVSFNVPEQLETIGEAQLPFHKFKGSYDIFTGPQITVKQFIGTANVDPGEYEISCEVTYQTCRDDLCLPPKTVTLTASVSVLGPSS